MIGPSNSPFELALLIFKEGKKRLLLAAGLFSIVALLALAIGLNMPKKWDTSATLLAEDTNIIKPLMDGRAVTTSVADSTALVTQTVLSRHIMREVLTFGGWL